MTALAVAAFTFTACEDVPEPYNNPYSTHQGSGEEPVVIDPAGSGTQADPWNVAALLEACNGLAADAFLNNSEDVYVKGIVTETNEVSTQYGNATYYISDDAKGSNRFYVFRGKLLDGASVTAETDLQVGDTVVVCGKVKNYKGNTLEFDQGNYLVFLAKGNGETPEQPATDTVGTKDAPKSVAEALTAINAMADGATSSEFWYVKGKVVKVTTSADNFAQYKNLNYTISDDGTETSTITVYAGNGLDNEQFSGVDALKAGDEVVVYGQLQKYVNKSGAMTPEIAKGNYLVSLNSNGETPVTGEAKGDGSLTNPFNAIAATNLAMTLADKEVTTESYYVYGKVATIKYAFDAEHGTATFFISEDGTTNNTFQIYSTFYFNNESWKEGDQQIQIGDDVIVYGQLTNYQGTPETASKKSCLYSLNGKTGSGENPTQPTPSGTGSLDNPLTASQAYDIVAAMESGATSDADYYVKGKISSIKYTFSSQYGTATFNISDDGNTGNKEFIVYGCYYFDNKPWVDGNTQIAVGDEIIACGKVVNYQGNTPEFANKQNWLVSINGKTSEGGSEVNPGGGEVSGNSITVVFGDLGITDLANPITLSDGTTLTFAKEDGTNNPVYHESTKIVRMYARNSVTINAGNKKIASVVFAYDTYNGTAYKGNDELYGQAGSNTLTPTKDDKNVTFTNVNSSTLKVVNAFSEKNSGGTQFRCTGLTITYAN